MDHLSASSYTRVTNFQKCVVFIGPPCTLNTMDVSCLTRLASNLRQTTCRCTSGYMTKTAVVPFDLPSPKTLRQMQTSPHYLLQKLSYCRLKFYITGIRIFVPFCCCDLDLDLMTFIYEFDRQTVEIHRMFKYKLPTSRLSKIIA